MRLEEAKTPQEKRDLVLKQLKDQLGDIDQINKDESGEIENDIQPINREDNERYRAPLSLELIKEVKILLCWGGGEDGFKLRFKQDELLSGVYYMADWGEYQEIDLNEDELNKVFEFYLYGTFPSDLK